MSLVIKVKDIPIEQYAEVGNVVTVFRDGKVTVEPNRYWVVDDIADIKVGFDNDAADETDSKACP
jgi:hypothetical protein